jgi:protein O-GlcNAc transferase
MTCFNAAVHSSKKEKHIRDNFCIARNAKVNAATKKIELGCTLRKFNEEEKARGVPKLEDFHDYGWFETGPFVAFNKTIELQQKQHWDYVTPSMKRDKGNQARFTIVMNRDANSFGHNFAEISSLILTLDIAKLTIDPKTGAPFFKDGDEKHTQLMILDERKDGYFLEMYSLAAQMPVRRIEHVHADEDLGTIIFPLASISNPMWLWCWTYHGCHGQWEWLRALRNRILDHYNLLDHVPRHPKLTDDEGQPTVLKDWNEKLVVTVIDRYNQSRELVNQDACISTLQKAYPDVIINIVRLKEYTFAEQFNITHNTDVLVGAHGAGMVHTVFLRPKSAAVELMPEGALWQGHRNEASGLGLDYFMTHTKPVTAEGKEKNWQDDKMFLEPEHFVRVVGTAIKSVYSHRSDNRDID